MVYRMKKIEVRTKKEFEEIKKQYRNAGYVFVTFMPDFAEMEPINGGEFVIIERVKRSRK